MLRVLRHAGKLLGTEVPAFFAFVADDLRTNGDRPMPYIRAILPDQEDGRYTKHSDADTYWEDWPGIRAQFRVDAPPPAKKKMDDTELRAASDRIRTFVEEAVDGCQDSGACVEFVDDKARAAAQKFANDLLKIAKKGAEL